MVQLKKAVENCSNIFICPKMQPKNAYELWKIASDDLEEKKHQLIITDISPTLVAKLKKNNATFPHMIYTLLKFKL